MKIQAFTHFSQAFTHLPTFHLLLTVLLSFQIFNQTAYIINLIKKGEIMKTLTKNLMMIIAMTMAVMFANAQSQIQFEGLYSDGEGAAAWDADGSGPEPFGNGHGTFTYYIASRDYVDPGSSSGAHILDNMTGFPLFDQAILDNGFSAEQLSIKFSLSSMGDDIEGIDWFQLGATHYANFYPVHCTFELDGYPMAQAVGDYLIYESSATFTEFESGFLKVTDISVNSTDPVKNVAAALLADLDNEELKMYMQVSSAANLTGNGRSGGYYDVTGAFEKGLPTFPFQGLNADNEGFAGWDADGSGPEPEANGHNTQFYYIASLDYDGIDPDPNACLGHFIEGSSGFLNTSLQLQYRGFEIGDLKLKLGLTSLGPDVEGEDWGSGWCNYYNNSVIVELDGEPILAVMQDTNKMENMTSYWKSTTSFTKVYDISSTASLNAQYVAQSFLKDMGTHLLRTNTYQVDYAGQLNYINGRIGAIYEITAGAFVGCHAKATFIPEGPVSGTWTAENSPYFVDGHLNVENGENLTIEPGVKVAMRGSYHFTVQGTVIAEGTMDAYILFTRSNPNLWWDGFEYDGTPTSNATSVFDYCIFEYGKAQGTFPYNCGGAFAIKDFNNVGISHSIFRSNMATEGDEFSGGSIALWNASPEIHSCVFYENTAKYGGAILCYEGSNAEISRNLFYNNTAEDDGGAIQIWENSRPNIVNNTFSLNTAGNFGGAIDVFSNSNPEFINNIFWGNTAGVTGQQISISSADCDISIKWCDVEGGEAGIGPNGIHNGIYENNIDEDPLFVDPANYVFLLDSLAPSPCIDTGDPLSPDDPDGSSADMGCYYQSLGKIQGFVRDSTANLTVSESVRMPTLTSPWSTTKASSSTPSVTTPENASFSAAMPRSLGCAGSPWKSTTSMPTSWGKTTASEQRSTTQTAPWNSPSSTTRCCAESAEPPNAPRSMVTVRCSTTPCVLAICAAHSSSTAWR